MKKIVLRKSSNEQLTTLAILRLVTTNSPNKALSVDEMRKRVRILDALDATDVDADYLQLEDEDVKTLCAAIETFPWNSANRELLTIIDDVLKAETIPLPMKLVKEKT